MKQLFTAEIIERLVYEDGQTALVLGQDDIVTPLARDRARELGLTLVYPDDEDRAIPPWSAAHHNPAPERAAPTASESQAEAGDEDLEARIRAAVVKVLGLSEPARPPRAQPRPTHVDGRAVRLAPFPFDIGRPEMDVRLADVITSEHGSPMAAGFMTLHKGQFPWHLDYDEIEYVIEGELHIITDQGTIVGLPGDVIFIPKGSDIQFATPSWAKFLYVTYPADWA